MWSFLTGILPFLSRIMELVDKHLGTKAQALNNAKTAAQSQSPSIRDVDIGKEQLKQLKEENKQ